jgi:lysosomal Pro-X carboxypeptidase
VLPGRKRIARLTRLCDLSALGSSQDVQELRDWLANAWDYMAMGNFPYPSGCALHANRSQG